MKVKRGTKENQQKAKKPKTIDTTTDESSVVVAALDGAIGLTQNCLSMLRVIIPTALSTPALERHESQNKVVDIATEVLAKVEEGLEAQAAHANAKVSEVVDEEAPLDAAEHLAELALTVKQKAVVEAARQLDESTAQLERAMAAWTEADHAQTQSKEDLRAALNEKEVYEAAMNSSLWRLKGLTPQTAIDADKHLAALVPLCESIGLDKSFMKAVPSAATKMPEARSAFDKVVFKHLEDQFANHVVALTEKLAAAAAVASKGASTGLEARANLVVATKGQEAKASELADAQAGHHDADAALKKAKRATHDVLPRLRGMEKERDAQHARLREFRQGPLATFQRLRASGSGGLCESSGGATAIKYEVHVKEAE